MSPTPPSPAQGGPRRRHRGFRVLAAVAVVVSSCASDLSIQRAAGPAPSVSPTPVRTEPAVPSPSPTVVAPVEGRPGAAGAADPYYPGLGNGGYDVSKYTIALSWDPSTTELVSTATLEATANQPLSSFNVDLHGLTIDDITVDDRPAAYARTGDEVTITPSQPLPAGNAFVVRVSYRGIPEPIAMGGIGLGGWTIAGDTVYVAGEPSGAQSWYPVNNHPTDPALFRYEITVPSDRTVVVNARLMETRSTGDALTTWVFESSNPHAPYLGVLAIGDFVEVPGTPVGDVAIQSWFDRALLDEVAGFEVMRDALATFAELFGPYPFESYGVLVVDESIGGALETQALSIFGDDFFAVEGAITDVVVHELAHQWFGNHVALAGWNDIWLNEGFATYSEFLFRERTDVGFDIDRAMARLAAMDPTLVAAPVPGDPGPDQLFAASVYFRGALTLHALRRTIGDDAFFDTLQRYVATFGGGNVVTADFVAVAEQVGGADLGDLFDEWLYREPLPALPPR